MGERCPQPGLGVRQGTAAPGACDGNAAWLGEGGRWSAGAGALLMNVPRPTSPKPRSGLFLCFQSGRRRGRSITFRFKELAESPNVTLQVMPVAVGAHPGAIGSFSILHFPEQYFPDVVYVECMTGALYIEDESQVHTHTLAFEQMQTIALSPDESAELIGRRVGR